MVGRLVGAGAAVFGVIELMDNWHIYQFCTSTVGVLAQGFDRAIGAHPATCTQGISGFHVGLMFAIGGAVVFFAAGRRE